MAIENESTDQVIRMVLQGSEVVLRLSGEAALRISAVIYNALKGDLTTKGRATLWEFLKSGKDQKLFTIPDEYLKAFTTASKKFGFPFVVLKDKTNKSGFTDIMVYATDASKVNRVIENLRLTVKQVETVKPEVKTESGTLIKPFEMPLKVPFSLIDGIPDPAEQDKRLLSELQKYATKMKQMGPQIADPVGLLCKPDGRYEILAGQGAKRIMALRLAGYKEAVAEIMIPKREGIEVKAENINNSSPNTAAKNESSNEVEHKANPTTARTTKSQAFGQNFVGRSRVTQDPISSADPEKRPSVRKKLEQYKAVAAERKASKSQKKGMKKAIPKRKSG